MAHGTGDGHAFVELRGDTVHIVYDEASAFKAVDWERVRGLASRLGLHVQAVVQELNKVAATARNWDRATWWFDDLNPRPQLIAAYEKPELFPGDWLRQYRQHDPARIVRSMALRRIGPVLAVSSRPVCRARSQAARRSGHTPRGGREDYG